MKYLGVWINALLAIPNAVFFVWTGNWQNGAVAVLSLATASALYLMVSLPTKESR